MRGRKTSLVVLLSDPERHQLESWCRSTSVAYGKVRRAQAVLAVAEGQTLTQASRTAHLSQKHVRKWIKRFLQQSLEGLSDQPRPGRPPTFSPSGGDARHQNRL
jgi:hypothetical protein